MNRFSSDTIPYLKGDKFSNGLDIKLKSQNDHSKVIMRLDYLEEIAKNKNVIHLGFADHLPLIKDKIKANKWLHKRLVDSASICWGIDIDKELVEFVKGEIGIQEVIELDVTADEVPEFLRDRVWDYMIIGEVLEHIDNPVHFLSSIYDKYKGIVKKIIVTVPNAHDLLNVRNIFKNIECINTDHRYWFTPYTLAKVGARAGLTVGSFGYSQSYMPKTYIGKYLIKRYPMLRETLIMTFDL